MHANTRSGQLSPAWVVSQTGICTRQLGPVILDDACSSRRESDVSAQDGDELIDVDVERQHREGCGSGGLNGIAGAPTSLQV